MRIQPGNGARWQALAAVRLEEVRGLRAGSGDQEKQTTYPGQGASGHGERRLGYSCMAAWPSTSRQALIFRRRQTQQSSSVENGATSAPQTTHFAARLATLAREARGGWLAVAIEADFFLLI